MDAALKKIREGFRFKSEEERLTSAADVTELLPANRSAAERNFARQPVTTDGLVKEAGEELAAGKGTGESHVAEEDIEDEQIAA